MEYTCTLTLSHTHAPTYFTQCQIKITQGNFQGCIYNHNDENSIFEVAEVKEQTTAQAKKNRCSHSHRAHSLETRYHVRRGVCLRGTCSTENEVQQHWRPDKLFSREAYVGRQDAQSRDYGLNHCTSAELW